MRAGLVGLVWMCGVFWVGDTAGEEEGFVEMFNGKDLAGWVNVNCAPETWSVKDGMVHCTGKPTGALRTERMYENFVLELEWRHLKAGGNAGVFIWAGPISAPGQPFLRAIEVQVLDHGYGKSDWFTTHGDVFPIHGSKMEPHGRSHGMRSFPSEERSKGSPEWNHYRIECNAGVLRLQVNGKEVSGGSGCNWRKGYIALESEGSPVDFRHVRVKELPPVEGLAAEMVADEARGHQALYNGADFRGWKEPEGAGRKWESKDWTFKAGEGTLWSEAEIEDGEVIVDYRFPKEAPEDAKASLWVRGREGMEVPLPNRKPGAWQRVQVKLDGEDCEIRWEPDTDATARTARVVGAIGLSADVAGVDFANVYLLTK